MTIVIAILILSAVIFFHELGHFLMAKANHVVVTEFAFGLGPRLLSFKKGDTTYAWRLLPFGGFCSMLGEDEEEDAEGSFTKASVWRRIVIVAAGPVFNFILAFLVSIIVISVVGSDPARVTSVPADSPEAEAGRAGVGGFSGARADRGPFPGYTRPRGWGPGGPSSPRRPQPAAPGWS